MATGIRNVAALMRGAQSLVVDEQQPPPVHRLGDLAHIVQLNASPQSGAFTDTECSRQLERVFDAIANARPSDQQMDAFDQELQRLRRTFAGQEWTESRAALERIDAALDVWKDEIPNTQHAFDALKWGTPDIADADSVEVRTILDRGHAVIERAAVSEINRGMVIRSRRDSGIRGIWTGDIESFRVLCFVSRGHIAVDHSSGVTNPEAHYRACRDAMENLDEGPVRGYLAVAPKVVRQAYMDDHLDECIAQVRSGTNGPATRDEMRTAELLCAARADAQAATHLSQAQEFAARHGLEIVTMNSDSLLLNRDGTLRPFSGPTRDATPPLRPLPDPAGFD